MENREPLALNVAMAVDGNKITLGRVNSQRGKVLRGEMNGTGK